MRELGDGGRLAGPIDAEHQHDRRRLLGTRERRSRGSELLHHDALERGLIDRLGFAQALDGLVRGRDAEIGFDQQPLHVLEPRVVDLAAAEQLCDLLPESHYGRP